MLHVYFVIALALSLSVLLIWGVRTLPHERWQMIAAVPIAKSSDGSWRGVNLTFYGFFSATGTTFGSAILLILLGSVGLPIAISVGFVLFVLFICVPSSRLIAGLVERKRNTFSVAGAAFVATIFLPLLVVAVASLFTRTLHIGFPVMPIFAAAAIAYALGESIGRLACLSFGCCYGVPLRDANPLLARLFRKYNLVIYGATKKASYAAGLSGEPLIPVQAITSTAFAIAGVAGVTLFLEQQFRLAALVTVVVTYGWRTCSEWLRADYRGSARISAYQLMAIGSLLYLSGFLIFEPSSGVVPNLEVAFWQIGSAPVIVGLQVLWAGLFLYYGRSRVTSSTLSFHVEAGRV